MEGFRESKELPRCTQGFIKRECYWCHPMTLTLSDDHCYSKVAGCKTKQTLLGLRFRMHNIGNSIGLLH